MYINKHWSNPGHVSVKIILCCRDLDLLSISLRPYYLLREFSHIIVLCVYSPPCGNASTACDKIHIVTTRLQTQHPEALIIISGDFNHTTLDSTLSAFCQVVNCPMRNNRTIDIQYTNVRNAHQVTALLRARNSAHIMFDILRHPGSKKEPAQRAKRLPTCGTHVSSDEEIGAALPPLPQAPGTSRPRPPTSCLSGKCWCGDATLYLLH